MRARAPGTRTHPCDARHNEMGARGAAEGSGNGANASRTTPCSGTRTANASCTQAQRGSAPRARTAPHCNSSRKACLTTLDRADMRCGSRKSPHPQHGQGVAAEGRKSLPRRWPPRPPPPQSAYAQRRVHHSEARRRRGTRRRTAGSQQIALKRGRKHRKGFRKTKGLHLYRAEREVGIAAPPATHGAPACKNVMSMTYKHREEEQGVRSSLGAAGITIASLCPCLRCQGRSRGAGGSWPSGIRHPA